MAASIIVSANNQTLHLNDGNFIWDSMMDKVVVSCGIASQNVTIRFDNSHEYTYHYSSFASPSGANAQAVQAAIAALITNQ